MCIRDRIRRPGWPASPGSELGEHPGQRHDRCRDVGPLPRRHRQTDRGIHPHPPRCPPRPSVAKHERGTAAVRHRRLELTRSTGTHRRAASLGAPRRRHRRASPYAHPHESRAHHMNGDNMPADQVEANQWQGMLRDWRTLLVWEIVVTVLTLVMVRQHLGLAVSVAVIDLAAVVQTLQVVKTRSTSSVGETRQRASVTTGLGAAALITLVGAVVACLLYT